MVNDRIIGVFVGITATDPKASGKVQIVVDSALVGIVKVYVAEENDVVRTIDGEVNELDYVGTKALYSRIRLEIKV